MCRWWFAVMVLAACGDNIDSEPTGVWAGNLAVADGTIFFTTYAEGPDESDHAVWARGISDGVNRNLWQGNPDGGFGVGMSVYDGRVYWPEFDPTETRPFIASVPVEGGAHTIHGAFPSPSDPGGGVAVDATGIFAAQSDHIIRLAFTGGATTVVHSEPPGIARIVRHGSALYATTSERDARLLRFSDAGAPQTIATGPFTGSFDISDEAAYLGAVDAIIQVPLNDTPVGRLPVDGDAKIVVNGPAGLFAVVTHRTDGIDRDTIVRVPLDGTAPVVLRDGLEYVFSMVLADNHLVFAQCDCSTAGFVEVIDL